MRAPRTGTRAACLAFLLLGAGGTSALAQQPPVYRGVCDASAAVSLGNERFVVAEDEHNVLLVYRIGQPEAVGRVDLTDYLGSRNAKGKVKESDIEGAARVGDRIYWIASHGRDKNGNAEPTRLRFFATSVVEGGSGPTVQALATPPFTRLLDAISAEKRFDVLKKASKLAPEDKHGLNIEGLAAAPDGSLLIGFRNPRPKGKALVLPLLNPAAVIDAGAAPVFGDLIALDLGGRGIRSLEWVDGSYAIVAGPHGDRDGNSKDFAFYGWAGAGSSPVRVKDVDFGALNPEALFKLPGTDRLYVLSDDGGMPVGGASCKEDSVPVDRKGFRGMTIRQPAAPRR